MSLESLTEAIVDLRKKKGFYTPPSIVGPVRGRRTTLHAELMLAKLMGVVTEVAEAAEACRDEDTGKFGAELADIIIRVLDIAGSCKIDIGAHVRAILAGWSSRPTRHGRKIRL